MPTRLKAFAGHFWPIIICALFAAYTNVQLLAQPINLAKYQEASADSSDGGSAPYQATDGFVNNDDRWYSGTTGPHWLEIDLKASYPIGSAHLYLGKDDDFTIANFELQYANGSGWISVPGGSRTGNTATDLNIVFATPVLANKFRIYTTDSVARVKEIALFGTNSPTGYPLGTDVNLNLVSQRAPDASTTYQNNHPVKAVDGYVDDNSRWLCANSSGPHTLTCEIPSTHLVGSIHLYSGAGSGSQLGALSIDYANGAGWVPVPGGTVSSGTMTGNAVTNNTSSNLVVNFSAPVSANKIRLTFTQAYGRIRELVVLPANVSNTDPGGYPLGSGTGSGYPIGASVKIQPDPNINFKDYHDDWYRIAAKVNNNSLISDANGSSQATTANSNAEKYFELLYSYPLNAYRLRNQDSGKCIEVKDAAITNGAPIVEGDYSAAPHQLWRLVATTNGYFQFVNVWSGKVLHSDAGSPANVTQQTQDLAANPADNQEWKPIFQDNYFKKGTGGWVGSFGTGWAYDWARNDKDNLRQDCYYVPMQHRKGWPNLGTLHKRYQDWNNDAKPALLLGFNEPDRPDQANMSVGTAIDIWPQLSAMDVPLVSPACSQGGENWWLNDFMDRVDNKGYRCEYAGGHWYSAPNVDSLFSFIDNVQNQANGRPVWLTEFSVIDWSGGSGGWCEEDSYNFILQFLWRAEDKGNLKKYAIFIFTGGSPSNPWSMSNPRSNFRDNSGKLTPFGKAYAVWDGDKTIHNDTPYLLHNRAARHRLQNDSTNNTPQPAWIRLEDNSVQWILQDAGGGKEYITSVVDGKRLRYDGTTLDYAPAGTTGADVEWTHSQDQYGWFNIIHSATGKFLRLNRVNNGNNAPTSMTFDMAAASSNAADWWFVKPYSEAIIPLPPTPTNLVATAGNGIVNLTWNSVPGGILGYNVYRSTAGDSPSLLETDIQTATYSDTNVVNGTNYTYTVSVTDTFGVESDQSNEASATPGISLPYAPTNIVCSATSSNITISWPSNYTGWLLQMNTNGLTSESWLTVPNAETNYWITLPVDPTQRSVFYRLKLP